MVPPSRGCAGEYHGYLKLPKEYPFKPPAVFMKTPSGRFKPSTRICLSMSDYHPESWVPTWTCARVVLGLLSFMLETHDTVGAMRTTDDKKAELAEASHAFNLKDPDYVALFPKLAAPEPDAGGGDGAAEPTPTPEAEAAPASAPAPAPAAEDVDPLKVLGRRVRIDGLSAAGWNGREGTAESYDVAAGRYTVEMGADKLAVRPKNVFEVTADAAGPTPDEEGGAALAPTAAAKAGRDPSDPTTWGKVRPNEACPCGLETPYKSCCGPKRFAAKAQ